MKLHRNNKGLSLVETLLALGLSATAGVAFMYHMKSSAKKESDQRVIESINTLTTQANKYLTSREICHENLSKAFEGVPLVGQTVTGRADYTAIRNRGFAQAGNANNSHQVDVFYVGQMFDGGKIYVSNVSYQLSELRDINIQSSPWNKEAKLEILVDFTTCRNGDLVFKNHNGVLVPGCESSQHKIETKKFKKLTAFKTDSSNLISTHLVNGVTRSRLTCADSQEALVKQAQDYTDIQMCLAEMKMLITMNRSGSTACGLKVSYVNSTKTITAAGTTPVSLPRYLNADLSFVELIGAGGGGGHKNNNKGGRGGGAGLHVKRNLASFHFTSGQNCSVTVGRAGYLNQQEPKIGGSTSFACGSSQIIAAGGAAGQGNTGHECGGRGADSIDSITGAIIGRGTDGNCKNDDDRPNDQFGAGGGGGNGRSKKAGKAGNRGGPGKATISIVGVNIEDPQGLLTIHEINLDDYLRDFPGIKITN